MLPFRSITRAEWLTCEEPAAMLTFLQGPPTFRASELLAPDSRFVDYDHGIASDRKLKLFSVACCRRQWRLISEAHCARLLDFGKQFGRKRHVATKGTEFNLAGVPLDACQRALDLAEREADEAVDAEE